MNEMEKKDIPEKDFNWSFCPVCGNKLPAVKKLRFCTKCGLDLLYLKEHKELPTYQNPPIQQQSFPYSYQTSPYQYTQTYSPYAPVAEKISEENILDTKGRKLWGNIASIGIPLAAFVIMNLLIVGITILLIIFTFDYNSLLYFITSPLFVVLTSLTELLLIFFPAIYIGKYLQVPTFKNRLILMGFTSKGYHKSQILKEVLIGLVFAAIGIFLVGIVSIITQLLIEYLFGVTIISDGSSSDIEYIVSSGNILDLILMVLVMLFVVGTSEEILFRGFMQKGLTRNLGQTWGFLITSFVFAIIHLVSLFLTAVLDPMTPFVFFVNFILIFAPYFSISLMLGWLYRWRNENLISNVITHGVYNSLTIIISFLVYFYI